MIDYCAKKFKKEVAIDPFITATIAAFKEVLNKSIVTTVRFIFGSTVSTYG